MPRAVLDGDVISLYNIADVCRNRSIGADPMFLHLRYQVSLSQESWRCRTTLNDAGCLDVNDITNLVYWDLLVRVTLPRHNI